MITLIYTKNDAEHFEEGIRRAEAALALHPGKCISLRFSSEHVLLRILAEVRKGNLRTDELTIIDQEGNVIAEVDVKGQFICPWPDDLFEASFYLTFGREHEWK
jgi:hypothetical protein